MDGGGRVACLGGTCDAVVKGPPLYTHCTTLCGPATVGIVNGNRNLTSCRQNHPSTRGHFSDDADTSEASSSTPAASPRLHRRSSPWPPGRLSHRDQKFSNPAPRSRVRTATSPYPPDLSWWAVKGRQTLISRVHLLVSLTGPASSGSADTSRRCQGCSHPHQRPLDQAAPSFHPAAATTRQRRSLTSIRLQTPRGARGFRPNRSRRTLSRNAPLSSLSVIEPSWSMRRTNGRTLRSDTRSAVHDPSAPQGPRPSTSAVQEWPRVIRRDAPCGWLDSRIVGPRQPAPARTRRPARHPPGARSSHRLSTAVEN